MGMTKEAVLKNLRRKDVIVLNVLPDDDFLKLHIKGSYNMALFQNRGLFAAEVEKEFGKDKFFITYSADITCAAGPNAAQALRNRGFNAQDYPGGVKEWREAGFPLEGIQLRQVVPVR
jgi:rhodanese-related sulfurtransferase